MSELHEQSFFDRWWPVFIILFGLAFLSLLLFFRPVL
jgi:hypothetical protein